MCSLIAYFTLADRQRHISEAEHRARDKALLLAADTERVLLATERSLDTVIEVQAADPSASASPSANFRAFLKRLIAENPYLLNIALIDAEGNFRQSAIDTSLPNVASHDFFAELKANPRLPLYIGLTRPSRLYPGKWVFGISRPLQTPDGSFAGIAVAVVDADRFVELCQKLAENDADSLGLTRSDGTVMIRAPDHEAFVGRVDPHVVGRSESLSGEGIFNEASPLDGVERIIAERRLAAYPLVAVSTVNQSAALASWYREVLSNSFLAFLLSIATIGGARLIYQQMRQTDRSEAAARHARRQLTEMLELNAEIVARCDVGITVFHHDGPCVFVNDSHVRLVGGNREQLLAHNFHSLASWRESGLLDAALKAISTGTPQRLDCTLVSSWGREICVETQCAPITWGGQPHLLVLFNDITQRKQSEDRLRQAAAVFSSTQEGVVITDLQGNVTAVNPAFCAITQFDEAEVLGHNMSLIKSGRHDQAFYDELWQALARDGRWQGEIWNRRKGGEIYPEWLSISSVRSEDDKPAKYVGTFIDISRIKQSEFRLEHLAYHDPLTDLPNRLLLESRLEHAVERVRRHGGCGAVLFCDLDHFKTVNDSLGHSAGDQLLQMVAQCQRGRLRETDTLARIGGDEFVVILEDLPSEEAAAHVAQSLIDQVARPFMLPGGHEVYVGLSVGISIFPADGQEAGQLLQNADAALYQAKANGRSTYRYYTEALTQAANTRLEMEAKLRRGLQRNEFILHFQPIVSLDDGRIRAVEALVRWQPDGAMVPPDQFIPLAEETGVIVPLGEWVLLSACRQMKAWLSAGISIGTMAVNLSPLQFRQADLEDRIGAILAQTGLPAGHLELEITEGALMDQSHDAEARLAALKAMGVRLAIDDFGTGYSSLAYLKRFPIDKLKIDRSFVQDIPDDPTGMEIAAAVTALAKSLRLEVVAEGIELEDQLTYLASLGCDLGQGYLFSRPKPAAEVEPLLLSATTAAEDDHAAAAG